MAGGAVVIRIVDAAVVVAYVEIGRASVVVYGVGWAGVVRTVGEQARHAREVQM